MSYARQCLSERMNFTRRKKNYPEHKNFQEPQL